MYVLFIVNMNGCLRVWWQERENALPRNRQCRQVYFALRYDYWSNCITVSHCSSGYVEDESQALMFIIGSDEITINGMTMKTFDLGGHDTARRLWKDYFPEVSAIVFLVDASDRARFNEAKNELDHLLAIEQLSTVPVLVLGNKIDLPQAASEQELRTTLGLMHTSGKNGQAPAGLRPIEVFMCSIVKKFGFSAGFEWLGKNIK